MEQQKNIYLGFDYQYILDIDPSILIINCTDINKSMCYEIQMLPQMITSDEIFPIFSTEQTVGRFNNNNTQKRLVQQIGDSSNQLHIKNIQLLYNQNINNQQAFIVESTEYKQILQNYTQTFIYYYEQIQDKEDIQQLLLFLNNPEVYQSQIKIQEFKNRYLNQVKQYTKQNKNVIVQIQPSDKDQLSFYTDNKTYLFTVNLENIKTNEQKFNKIDQYIKLYKQKRILSFLQQQDILSLLPGEKLIVAQLIDDYSKMRLEKLLLDMKYDGCPIYYIKDKIDKQSREKIQQQIPGTDFYILYYRHPKTDQIIQQVFGDRYRIDNYYTDLNYQLSDEEFQKLNQLQLQKLKQMIQKLNKIKPQSSSDYLHISNIYKQRDLIKEVVIVVNFWIIILIAGKIASTILNKLKNKNIQLNQLVQ